VEAPALAMMLCWLIPAGAFGATMMEPDCPWSEDWDLHDSTALFAALTANGLLGSWNVEGDQPSPGLLVEDGDFETLFMGSLWVGARVDGEVHVSAVHDGWYWDREIRALEDDQALIRRDPGDERVYAARLSDRFDGCEGVYETHRPMLIDVDRAVVGPRDPSAEFLLLVDRITNRSAFELQDCHVGLYWDGDVGPTPRTMNDAWDNSRDDVTGSRTIDNGQGGETLLAFIADGIQTGSDGDDTLVPTGVGVTRLVFAADRYDWSSHCNWWISDAWEPLDWGPGLAFPDGGDGTPLGDANKYRLMSNWAGEDPDPDLLDVGDPDDARFMLSHRVADLAPGATEVVVWAVVAGLVWPGGELSTEELEARVLEARDYARGLPICGAPPAVRRAFSYHAPIPIQESAEDDPS